MTPGSGKTMAKSYYKNVGAMVQRLEINKSWGNI
jgi:hypothetical protein